MKKVIVHFGKGSICKGFEAIVAELYLPNNQYPIRVLGSLPPVPELASRLQQWQSLYLTRYQNQALRIQLLHCEGSRYSNEAFLAACTELESSFKVWLGSVEFRAIEQMLRTELGRLDEIQVILETWEHEVRKLPWHLWQFFEDYPKAEVTLSGEVWRELSPINTAADRVRILSVLGVSHAIDTQTDFELLRQLPKTELMTLETPSRQLLNEQLWQGAGWDIFYFAGHSQTEGAQGCLYLNDRERLTIPQLKNTLGQAIANGLKIAIFNSCDGLGLAQQLSDLQIPYVIVMREPVPDQIAHQFLRHFLDAFSAGVTFHLAVREARQRLEGLEGVLPCATWLPIIWQNPAAPPLCWQDLCQPRTPSDPLKRAYSKLKVMAIVGIGALTVAVRFLGLLEPLEMVAYDQLMRQRPAEPIDSRIVVIEINQTDTNRYGYPLPDETLSTLLQQLTPLQPSAIGINVHRPEARGPGYDELMQQFEAHHDLFMVCAFSINDRNYKSPLSFSESQRLNQVGFSDLLIDAKAPSAEFPNRSDLAVVSWPTYSHQPVRRHLLSYDTALQPSPSGCSTPYSFSFQLAFEYLFQQGITPLTVNDDEIWQLGSVAFHELPQRFGGYQNLEPETSQIMLNYRSNQPGHRLNLSQVLAGEIDPQVIKDHIVMIGYTAPISKDYFQTPYGSMPGVWVHAHMVSQLISGVLDQRPLIRGLSQWHSWQWGDALWIIGWSMGTGMVMIRLNGHSNWHRWGAIALAQGSLYQICRFALVRGLWLPWVPTALAITLVATLMAFWQHQPKQNSI